ncbi:MAG: polysaccharide deacetylase family protein [Verrucomicrobia bacterium]|nr:MAG: polysaccharide deacetylase family protein [Verrucomicrobiota bacterium]
MYQIVDNLEFPFRTLQYRDSMNKTPFLVTLLSLLTSAVVSASTPSPAPILSSPPLTSPAGGSATSAPGKAGKETDLHDPRLVYSSVHVSGPYIAMTFDDGPNPATTPKLLDLLKAKGIKATFFLVGKNVAAHPEIVKRIYAEGHEVANHSWSHPPLSKCSPEKFNHELSATNEAIQSASGFRPTLIRPPYGATNANLDRIINEKYGMKVILWSVDPMDWKYRNSQHVTNFILSHTKAGDIVLSHDIHPTTVAAMPAVFDGLLAKGFKFVTVSELIALQTPRTPKTTAPKAGESPLPHSSPASSTPLSSPAPSTPPAPAPTSQRSS